MKHKTLAALKRTGISALCLSVIASCTLPFMGNKKLTAAEKETAAVLATLRDFSKEIEVPNAQKKKSLEKVKFIENNLDTLREEYAKYAGEEFYGTYVESWAVAYVIGEKDLATYINFDEDNGYMVVGNENQLYDFQVSGDKEYLEGKDVVLFGKQCGFVYYDTAQGKIVEYEHEPVSEVSPTYFEIDNFANIIKDTDVTSYINEHYGDYELEDDYTIPKYTPVLRYDTAIYWKGSDWELENSQNLTACYAAMNNWKEIGLCPNFYSYNEVMTYDPETMEPGVFAQSNANYYSVRNVSLRNPYAYRKSTSDKSLDNLPKLYEVLRRKAIFIGDGSISLSMDNILAAMYLTCGELGEEIHIKQLPKDIQYALQFMRLNNGSQLLTIKSGELFHTAINCYGYKHYTKEEGWWIFSKTVEGFILKVDTHEYGFEKNVEVAYIDSNNLHSSDYFIEMYYYDNIYT